MDAKEKAENALGGFAVAFFGGICLFTWPELILSAAVWLCPSHAAIANLSSFQLGSLEIHPSGVANAALFFFAAVFIAAHLRESRLALNQSFLYFALFAVFTALRIWDAPDKGMAAKEFILLAIPLAVGIVAWVSLGKGVKNRWVEKQLLVSPLLLLAFLAIEGLSGVARYNEFGLVSTMGKGPIAVFGLPILALALSFWRYEKGKKWPLFATLLPLGLILLTVERTAAVVALVVLVPLRFVKFERGLIRNVLTWLSVALLAALLVLQAPAVRSRFFELKESSFFDQDASIIDTSGRTVIWLVTIDHALSKPFLGHGAGSAEVLTRETLVIDHPHDEYLRIWHDLGVIGVALLLVAWVGRLLRHFKLWWSLDGSPELARPHMAAALASLALLLSFATDSTLLFTPVQIPAFLLFAIADRSIKGAAQ